MCNPSQNAEERNSASVCPAFAAAKSWHKLRPANSITIQSVLYNHLSDVLPLFRLWQVQVEPVALALGHVHQEGIDLNSNSCELYAVGVVERSLVAEGDLGTQVAFVLQHPAHLIPFHLALYHFIGGGVLEGPSHPI